MRGRREGQACAGRLRPQHQKIDPPITLKVALEPVHDLLTARDWGAPVDQINTWQAEFPFYQLDKPVLHFDVLDEDERALPPVPDPAQDVHRRLQSGGHGDIGRILRGGFRVRVDRYGPDMVEHLEGAATGPGGEFATCLLVNGRLRCRHKTWVNAPALRGQILGDLLLETAECHRWQTVLRLKHLARRRSRMFPSRGSPNRSRNSLREPRRPGVSCSMIAQRSTVLFSIGVPVSPIRKSAFTAIAALALRVVGFFTFWISSNTAVEKGIFASECW